MEKNDLRPERLPLIAYVIPTAVALIGSVGFLIQREISLLSLTYFAGLAAFGFTIHFLVVRLGIHIFDAVAQLAYLRARKIADHLAERVPWQEHGVREAHTRCEMVITSLKERYGRDIELQKERISPDAWAIIKGKGAGRTPDLKELGGDGAAQQLFSMASDDNEEPI